MAAPTFHLGLLHNNWFAALSESGQLGSVPGIFRQLELLVQEFLVGDDSMYCFG
jgi:hypothetical protein